MPFAPSIFSAFCRPDGSICVYPIGYFVVFLIECKSFHAPITFIHSTIVLATSQHRPCPQRTPEGTRLHFLPLGRERIKVLPPSSRRQAALIRAALKCSSPFPRVARNKKWGYLLVSPLFIWYTGRDSNPQPSEPESDALSIEPPVHLLDSLNIIAVFSPFVKSKNKKFSVKARYSSQITVDFCE